MTFLTHRLTAVCATQLRVYKEDGTASVVPEKSHAMNSPPGNSLQIVDTRRARSVPGRDPLWFALRKRALT